MPGGGWHGSTVRESELIGGVEKRHIEVVPYDSGWPTQYLKERRRIVAALGSAALRVDHVGSTAVPGLAAKPVIDIEVSVADPDDEPSYLPQLEAAGYHLRVRSPGHRMVRTPARDVHVHVYAHGSNWEREHLLFRDWLRVNPADRELYQATKQQLAQHEWSDMNEYAEAKTRVIRAILRRANAWVIQTGWTLPHERSLSQSDAP